MEYVLTENGNILITDGKPTVKGEDGKQFAIDAIGAQDKINTITTESNDRRKKLGEVNKRLEAFAGIEDPAAALEAIQTVGSLSENHKLEIEKLKASMNEGWEGKVTAKDEEIKSLQGALFTERVSNKFATSEIIKKTTLPPQVAAQYWEKNFSPDGTAQDGSGNIIYAKDKPGEPAGFEEAIEYLINASPFRDSIWRGSGAGGSGSHTTNGGDGTGKEMARSSFEKLSSQERSRFVLSGGIIT